MLAQHAVFQVNINSGRQRREESGRRVKIAHRAVDLICISTVGIIHDNNGQLKPLGEREQSIFEEIMELGSARFRASTNFNTNAARGREHNWLPVRVDIYIL
jgi:hypothetical protein